VLAAFLALFGDETLVSEHGFGILLSQFLRPKKQKAGTETISDFDPGRG
jgi:hypothetical protein